MICYQEKYTYGSTFPNYITEERLHFTSAFVVLPEQHFLRDDSLLCGVWGVRFPSLLFCMSGPPPTARPCGGVGGACQTTSTRLTGNRTLIRSDWLPQGYKVASGLHRNDEGQKQPRVGGIYQLPLLFFWFH